MLRIPLTKGFVAIIDDEDYASVSKHSWIAKETPRNVYAQRAFPKGDGTQGWETLHQFLMPGVKEIDHRDGDGLNNRRYNLRPCTRTQNLQGKVRKRLSATSKYRGVCWIRPNRKWQATIQVNKKSVYLGLFIDEAEAARVYDAAAIKFFGEFASPNFPQPA